MQSDNNNFNFPLGSATFIVVVVSIVTRRWIVKVTPLAEENLDELFPCVFGSHQSSQLTKPENRNVCTSCETGSEFT